MSRGIAAGIVVLLVCIACNNKDTGKQTYTSGFTTIIADESFAPIVEDQLFVFRKSYPNADIKVTYKPENQLLNMFFNDSARIAVMSRKLTGEERKRYENKSIIIRETRFAIDGIALVTHVSAKDSIITVNEIIDIMRGKNDRARKLVFDNANSGTVRYLKELSGIKALPETGVYGLGSNPEVIKFVHNNQGTIGVIGINWMVEPQDEKARGYISKLKIMGVKNIAGKPGSDNFYKPNQNDLALGLYALTRDLYIVNCEGGPGLGSGFASFIAGERGQRIVLKSGLLPDKIPSREIIIRNKFIN